MSLELAVALVALLVALFALVALVAVYARVRGLEAGRAAELSGYASLVGKPAPAAVRPRTGESGALVAVIDGDCALCHGVWDALSSVSRPGIRFVALSDRADAFGDNLAEMLVDPDTRAGLFEGYSPTVLALDAAGTVTDRRFVYADTDVRGLLLDLLHPPRASSVGPSSPDQISEHEVSKA